MNVSKIQPQFISVPFKADSPHGITEYNGIAKFSPAGIVIEFQSVIIGLIDGDVKEVQIPLSEIIDIKFRRGFYKFFSQIQFRLRNFATLSRLPNNNGRVKLKIKREDFEIAERAVKQLSMQLDVFQNSVNLAGEVAPKEQLPPTHTPVSYLFDETEDETRKFDNQNRQ